MIMVLSDLLEAAMIAKDEWSSVPMKCGAPFVTTYGVYQMLKLCAGSWDMPQQVHSYSIVGG